MIISGHFTGLLLSSWCSYFSYFPRKEMSIIFARNLKWLIFTRLKDFKTKKTIVFGTKPSSSWRWLSAENVLFFIFLFFNLLVKKIHSLRFQRFFVKQLRGVKWFETILGPEQVILSARFQSKFHFGVQICVNLRNGFFPYCLYLGFRTK